MELKQQIEVWLQPLLEEKDLFLTDIKISGKAKVEVYVDADNGITIEQCAEISRFLEKHLDGSGLVSDHYLLDVSSPGMSNPLRVPRQYKRRIGRILDIIKADGTELEAELVAVDDEKITLKTLVKEEKKKKKGPASTPSPLERDGVRTEEPKTFELKYGEIKKALIQLKW